MEEGRTLAAKQALIVSETIKELKKKEKRNIERCCDVAKANDSVFHNKLFRNIKNKRIQTRHHWNNKEDSENDKKLETEMRERYNPDNLFKKKEKVEQNDEAKEESTEIIEYKEQNILKKILNRIMKFFKKNNY